ncbi:MAG: TraR/DksA family transcriptional regulator [Planctomycetes bacterium]|nr:TraR/DksA family transcriptional regulator [Planctomycetota bacterium]
MVTRRASLSGEQLDHMRELLLDREHELQHELSAEEHAADIEDERGDEGDQANSAMRQEGAIQVRCRESRELQLIEEALRRLESGGYGRCEDCGGEISLPRLRAKPFAEFCLPCQEKAELRGRRVDAPDDD